MIRLLALPLVLLSCAACSGVSMDWQGSSEARLADDVHSGFLAQGFDDDSKRKADAAPSLAADIDVPDQEDAAALPQPSQDRKVLYSADYRLRVPSAEEAARQTRAMVGELGGWIQEESTTRMILRVPSERFEEATRRLADIGRVLQHAIRAQDVTEEYTDLELRLEVKRRFLAELQALYARGGNLADLLTVKRELDRVTEEIERIEGRLRFLSNRIAMATIQVQFEAVSAKEEPVGRDFDLPFPWLRSLGIHTLLSGRSGR